MNCVHPNCLANASFFGVDVDSDHVFRARHVTRKRSGQSDGAQTPHATDGATVHLREVLYSHKPCSDCASNNGGRLEVERGIDLRDTWLARVRQESRDTLQIWDSLRTEYSAKVFVPQNESKGFPLILRRVAPSLALKEEVKSASRQRLVFGLRQRAHASQFGMKSGITWSPAETRVTPAPTDSTTAAPSWPKTTGSPAKSTLRSVSWFHKKWASLAHKPAHTLRTRTSPSSGGSTVMRAESLTNCNF